MNIDIININSIQVDGIDREDFPDMCDSYASYAEFKNGRELSDEQLDDFNELHAETVQELARKQCF